MPTHASEVALSNGGADDDEAYEGEAMRAYDAEYGDEFRDDKDSRDDKEDTTTTSFTKDSTATQSMSNYDNYKESSLSFDRIHSARRDANSAIGDYVARVSGISLGAGVVQRQREMARSSTRGSDIRSLEELGGEDIRRATSSPSRDPRSSSTRGSDIRSLEELGFIDRPNTFEDYRLAGDMDTLAQSSRRSSDAGIRQQQDALLAAGMRASVSTGNEFADYEKQIALTGVRRQVQIDEDKAVKDARLAEAIRIDTENNSKVIKQAEEVLASPVTSETEKTAAATRKYAVVSEKNRLAMEQRRIRAHPEYNAVTDPTATVYSKDAHTKAGYGKLTNYIDSIANRPFFNTGWEYTKHDPATTMKVQKAIERYRDIYGANLNNMGRRNTDEINSKGFDLSKGAGYMGINIVQGILNRFNLSYHATQTEKDLRALERKWGLSEDEPEGGLPLDEQETRCNERSGYKWDEKTNTCIPISNLNTDYRDYLPD